MFFFLEKILIIIFRITIMISYHFTDCRHKFKFHNTKKKRNCQLFVKFSPLYKLIRNDSIKNTRQSIGKKTFFSSTATMIKVSFKLLNILWIHYFSHTLQFLILIGLLTLMMAINKTAADNKYHHNHYSIHLPVKSKHHIRYYHSKSHHDLHPIHVEGM